jgi:site-specific DNA-methyltransferase (adenine-specific)
MEYKLILGDCLIKLKELEDNSVDSVVTDSPYGISFMGQKWDYDVPSVDVWKECYRVLKPGGHLLSFSGSRTYHRMAVNIEDAGFEIRDQIMWVYGSGFPKSLNVGKAIDKKLGNEREVVGIKNRPAISTNNSNDGWKRPSHYNEDGTHKTTMNITVPASEEAKQWEGWGTALKPAHEPIVLARKPFRGDVASNVLEHGTGALNIDGCRVGDDEIKSCGGRKTISTGDERTGKALGINGPHEPINLTHIGRWPANFIHDGSDEVLELFPTTGSSKPSEKNKNGGEFPDNTIKLGLKEIQRTGFEDSGSAARYFYCPKANKKDRNEGCESLEEKNNMRVNAPRLNENEKHSTTYNNSHPTIKPTDLMRYLCRLITPKNGTVLDPFMGSGSTGKAAMLEEFNFIGIELMEEYLDIAEKRIKKAKDDS